LDDYSLAVPCADGVRGGIRLKDQLYGPVFEPLTDVHLFKQA